MKETSRVVILLRRRRQIFVKSAWREIPLLRRTNRGRRGDVDEGGSRKIHRNREKMSSVVARKMDKGDRKHGEAHNPPDDNRFTPPVPRPFALLSLRNFAPSIRALLPPTGRSLSDDSVSLFELLRSINLGRPLVSCFFRGK